MNEQEKSITKNDTEPDIFAKTRSSIIRAWYMALTNLADLTDNRRHTVDFDGSRSEFINDRARTLALFFALLVPLWIPVDYFMLGESFLPMMMTRLVVSAAFLVLALWTPPRHDLRFARLQLFLLVLVQCLFYWISHLQLNGNVSPWALMGYSFYPMVIVVQLAIFPLVMAEGLALVLPVLLVVILKQLSVDAIYTSETAGTLWLLLLLASLALWAAMSQLHMLLRLYRQATMDTLTGLFNRRALMDRLNEEIDRSHRYSRPLSVLLFDLDKFKRINDTHGHLAGDEVLRHFAAGLQTALRTSDHVGRYGGEEFLALLPETPARTAQEVAERIRTGCHGNPAISLDGEQIPFTTSIGVAELGAGEQAEDLLARVDESLYQAKESGRDLVVVASR